MASSPRAADLLIYAAYDKDLRTVKAMLSHGVGISAPLTTLIGEPLLTPLRLLGDPAYDSVSCISWS